MLYPKKKVLTANLRFRFFYVNVGRFEKCISHKTHDSSVCHGQVLWEKHQPQDRLLRQTGSPASRTTQGPISSPWVCANCALVSLSHWTHVFHTGDESVPFARNICLLVSCQDDLRDLRDGPRRAIITILYTLWPIMWSHAFVGVALTLCFMRRAQQRCLCECLRAWICQTSVQTYGLTGTQAPQKSFRTD